MRPISASGRTKTVAELREKVASSDTIADPALGDTGQPADDMPRQSVLVVDDSPTDLRYLGRLLEAPDRHVLLASSGEQALKILKGVEFALVILDVRMEGMSGFRTAAKMKTCSGAMTPVRLITYSNRSNRTSSAVK